jgi:hypothetical protein
MEVSNCFPSSILWEIHPTAGSQPAPAFKDVMYKYQVAHAMYKTLVSEDSVKAGRGCGSPWEEKDPKAV